MHSPTVDDLDRADAIELQQIKKRCNTISRTISISL